MYFMFDAEVLRQDDNRMSWLDWSNRFLCYIRP